MKEMRSPTGAYCGKRSFARPELNCFVPIVFVLTVQIVQRGPSLFSKATVRLSDDQLGFTLWFDLAKIVRTPEPSVSAISSFGPSAKAISRSSDDQTGPVRSQLCGDPQSAIRRAFSPSGSATKSAPSRRNAIRPPLVDHDAATPGTVPTSTPSVA
jgi:hypothetical protein